MEQREFPLKGLGEGLVLTNETMVKKIIGEDRKGREKSSMFTPQYP